MISSSPVSPSTETPLEIGRRSFPWREEVKIRIWAGLTFFVLVLLKWTTRKRYLGAEELFSCWQRGEQVIVAFWHNRMLMMPFAYRGRRACILNSAHRDGEIVTRVIRHFGISAVRGSSTRGWLGGLRGMIEAYRRGYDLIVVPDGPRGPRLRAKAGAVQLAKATGAPIFPVTYAPSKALTVPSWDRLLVPLPFCCVLYATGPALTVPADASSEELAVKCQELEERLLTITAEAEAELGKPKAGRELG
jgi:lysophospholipid acyltransferase (LPLAT)-like uncharacterized protein